MKHSTSTTARQVQHLLLATIGMLIPVYAFSMIENLGFAGFLSSPIAGALSIIYSITILAVWNKQKNLPELPKVPCISHKATICFAFVLAFCWFSATGATIGITVTWFQSPDWGTTLAGRTVLPAFEAASDFIQAILFVVLGFKMIKARKEFLNNPEVCLAPPLSVWRNY